MDIFDGKYYKVGKKFLEFLGLWPYQSPLRRAVGQFMFFTFGVSLSYPQVLKIIEVWGENFYIVVENTCSLGFLIGCNAKFRAAAVSGSNIKLLFLQIVEDWQTIKEKDELKIMHKYSEEGRVISLVYAIYMLTTGTLYASMPFVPLILDHTFPLKNGTYKRVNPFYAKYGFFEQDDHFYVASWHAACVYAYYAWLFVGLDTIFLTAVKHNCALFDIICHRLDKLTAQKAEKPLDEVQCHDRVINELSGAVALHARTIRCATLLEDSFSKSFFVIFALSVIEIALVGSYLTYVVDQKFHFFRAAAFLIGLLLHTWFLNYVGQMLITSSESVFDSTYNCRWYGLKKREKTILLYMMLRAMQPCVLTAAGLATLSMETFGNILRTSASYFTVFVSAM